MPYGSPTIVALGDAALLVTFAATISRDANDRVRAASARVRALRLGAVTDVVPAYTTLAVYFDSSRVAFDEIVRAIAPAIISTDVIDDARGSLVEIPVRYDGPDLSEVAERTGLKITEVIDRHLSRTYHAYMSGFVPGFTYLGELDDALILPRRSSPRVHVPAGSVAIAGAQTAVYPLETPGGWHLIGSTSVVMFDPQRKQPALIRAGDTVRFINADR